MSNRISGKLNRIATKLAMIAVLPILLMFLAFTGYIYYVSLAETREVTGNNGSFIALNVAANCEYGLFSGNISDITKYIQKVKDGNDNISAIEVFDRDRKLIARTDGDISPDANHIYAFEQRINNSSLGADSVYDFSGFGSDIGGFHQQYTYGFVKVYITAARVIERQQIRILVTLGIATVALAISLIIGITMSTRLRRDLSAITNAIIGLSEGNYSIWLDTSPGEIGEVNAAIIDLATSMQAYKLEMDSKVAAKTADLERSNREKRRLIHSVNEAVELERKNIAVELHDHLNALLILIRLDAKRINEISRNDITQKLRGDIQTKSDAILDNTGKLYSISRNLVRGLRPEIIDTIGLVGAIEDMLKNYNESNPDCTFKLNVPKQFPTLPGGISLTAYRLIQETLSNVVKHANASMACVSLAMNGANDLIQIEVVDNGQGFDRGSVEAGIGLIGMEERVVGVDGHISINSAVGYGTKVSISLPIVSNNSMK